MYILLASKIVKSHIVDSVQIEELEHKVESLHTVDSLRVDQLQHRVESLHSLIDSSYSVISNEIASSNNYLTVISIVIGVVSLFLTVIGFGIGYYINSLCKKVKDAENTISEKERIIKDLSHAVKETDDKITNDLESIYNRLRREELKAILKRLETEPLDICHYQSILLANDLEDVMFESLYRAYQKLKASGNADRGASIFESSYKNKYLLVFFQHYLCQSLLNVDLREDIIKFFEEGCRCAFERDMIKCTNDLCKALNELKFPKRVDVMCEYLIAVNKSEFKSLTSIKVIIDRELLDKSILRQAVDRCTSNSLYLELFDNKVPIDDEQ